jgi:transposase
MPARKSRYSEAQIRAFLWQAAAGTPVIDLCWNHGFSRSTFHAWKAKYGARCVAASEGTGPFKTRSAPRNDAFVARNSGAS